MQSLITKGAVTALLVVGLLFFGSTVQAQSTSTDQSTIEALQQQVEELQERVEELRTQLQDRISNDDESDSATSTDDDFRSRIRLRIDQQLSRGDRGPNVERLQELLSSNSDIYPEGLVTGYFGPLTESAVARLQARLNLPSVGNVGSQTMQRINQLLEDGAGNSGMVPPGLLTAPGIQRALFGDTSTSSDDTDDSDDDNDDSDDTEEMDDDDNNSWRSRIDIDNLSIPERIKVRLRNAFGDFRFESKDDDDDDDEDEDDELEIEAEAEDGETEVEIEYADGTEEEFTFDTMDRSEVIDRLVDETDLTEDEIEAVIDFEIDDDDEDDEEEDDDENEDDDEDEDDDNDDED